MDQIYRLLSGKRGRAYIGWRGEQLAARYLRKRGCRIIVRNWRAGRYELDIVAWEKNVLLFVEVKTRREGALGGGFESIDARKRRALRVAVRRFLHGMYPVPAKIRFDVIEVWFCMSGQFRLHYIPNVTLFPEGLKLLHRHGINQ